MQKKLIALAVAGLVSGGAYAQSNVTIYGVVDAYVAHRSADNGLSQNALDSGGLSTSRLGFKGEEDLGNGLKALFTLEYSLFIDQNQGVGTLGAGSTAANAAAARQQFVGVSSKTFGTLVAGRLQTHSFNASGAYGGGVGGTAFSPLSSLQFGIDALQTGYRRFDNAVSYVSPTFAGFNAVASYSFGKPGKSEATTSDTRDSGYELGANYNNGPLSVGYVFARTDAKFVADPTATPVVVNDYKAKVNANFLGGSYDFGVAKLKASYQTQKSEGSDLGGDNAETAKFNIWQLGVDVPVTAAGTVRASYASLDNKLQGATSNDAKAWTLGYTHALSKRTTAYAAYTQVKNDGGQTIGLYSGLKPTVGGGDSSIFGLGVSHSF